MLFNKSTLSLNELFKEYLNVTILNLNNIYYLNWEYIKIIYYEKGIIERKNICHLEL